MAYFPYVTFVSVISFKTSGLSLKLYLNSLVYHRNIFGSSSEVFANLRKSSEIFGNFRNFSENVRERSSGIRNNFTKRPERELGALFSKLKILGALFSILNGIRQCKHRQMNMDRLFYLDNIVSYPGYGNDASHRLDKQRLHDAPASLQVRQENKITKWKCRYN